MSERVKQLLRIYFLSGNVDKTNRFTPDSMLVDLKKRVETGELEMDEIPTIKTIENWVTRFGQQHKKESAEKFGNKLFLFRILYIVNILCCT